MLRAFLAILLLFGVAAPVPAETGQAETGQAETGQAEMGRITRQSAFPVGETLDRLQAALEPAGITVVARIDHAAAARRAGLELPPTELLIFGNPALGTPLMQSARTAGLDLPLKVLAWEDAEGTVWVTYADPAALAQRHGITDRAEIIGRMTAALDRFTATATGAEPGRGN